MNAALRRFSWSVFLLGIVAAVVLTGCDSLKGKKGDKGSSGPGGAAGPPGTPPLTGYSVQGAVVDSTGLAVAGALVQIGSGGSVRSMKTDLSGVYTFNNLEPGAVWIDVNGNGVFDVGDTIAGSYTISVTFKDATHDVTAVKRDVVVGSIVAGPTTMIALFECTGAGQNIDDYTGTPHPLPSDSRAVRRLGEARQAGELQARHGRGPQDGDRDDPRRPAAEGTAHRAALSRAQPQDASRRVLQPRISRARGN